MKEVRDPLTGHMTTGHEWNGITELNTRVPRAIWLFILVTHVWALIIWILLPAWPVGTTYTKGVLGLDQRQQVNKEIAAAERAFAERDRQIRERSVPEIMTDVSLMNYVMDTASAIFGDNCAVCHGTAASGGPGYPSLIDTDWLWGGDTDQIMETLRVGINSQHPDTRHAQMPAFGRLGILSGRDVRLLVPYVKSLSGSDIPVEVRAAGEDLFSRNCSSCHGADGMGRLQVGAPNLTDDVWLYGGGDNDIFYTIWDGRQGWMPAWQARLSHEDRKMLVVYLQELADGERP
jgi:cytochrome c oxidase cbb3-type subunit 3